MKTHQALSDEISISFVRGWVESHLAGTERPKSINTTAPLLAIAALARLQGGERYYEVCEEYADWCLGSAPRLPDGTLEHSCTENSYPFQVWADTLFMGCLFMAHWGLQANRPELLRESVFQFLQHYRLLEDSATGLIHHGYYGLEGAHRGVLWGRGNGWFAAASAELLSILPVDMPHRGEVEANLRRHLGALLAAPRNQGAWHTVLNDPTTGREMSCTAAFAYAFAWAARQPWGTADHALTAESALEAIMAAINPSGELLGASGGTPLMSNAAEYGAIPHAVTCFAQGLALIALSEKVIYNRVIGTCGEDDS